MNASDARWRFGIDVEEARVEDVSDAACERRFERIAVKADTLLVLPFDRDDQQRPVMPIMRSSPDRRLERASAVRRMTLCLSMPAIVCAAE
jgi:hypothetical protein